MRQSRVPEWWDPGMRMKLSSSWLWGPVIRSPAHNQLLLLQLPINKFCWGCYLHSLLTTLATCALPLESTILCAIRLSYCWMVPMDMRHHRDHICLLVLMCSGHCIQLVLPPQQWYPLGDILMPIKINKSCFICHIFNNASTKPSKSHYRDRTLVRSSFLHTRNNDIDHKTSKYWNAHRLLIRKKDRHHPIKIHIEIFCWHGY